MQRLSLTDEELALVIEAVEHHRERSTDLESTRMATGLLQYLSTVNS
jgi:hypothetical protein